MEITFSLSSSVGESLQTRIREMDMAVWEVKKRRKRKEDSLSTFSVLSVVSALCFFRFGGDSLARLQFCFAAQGQIGPKLISAREEG